MHRSVESVVGGAQCPPRPMRPVMPVMPVSWCGHRTGELGKEAQATSSPGAHLLAFLQRKVAPEGSSSFLAPLGKPTSHQLATTTSTTIRDSVLALHVCCSSSEWYGKHCNAAQAGHPAHDTYVEGLPRSNEHIFCVLVSHGSCLSKTSHDVSCKV